MLKILIMLVFASTTLFASPREEASEILDNFANLSGTHLRLEKISRTFLGLPYGKGGPLGEGPQGQFDQDPLYRFDTFDCTTFVETIMALALSPGTDEFEMTLNKIRYEGGEVSYFKRNHFTDLQWIPFNIQNGYMKEINHLVVPSSKILLAKALINFPGWILSHKIDQIVVPMASMEEKENLLDILHREAPFYESQLATVPYISIQTLVNAPQYLNNIPSGAVVNFVRPNWDLTEAAGTHQNISHQGFLFRIGNVLYLRHASTSGKVEQLPFIEYLKKFVNHATLKGVHLMQVN